MPKKSTPQLPGFGPRLAELRNAAGYTQTELAEALGVSQRMIAYYESPKAHPPAALLPDLAKVLGITTDELLGMKTVKKSARLPDNRLVRRIQQIEKMDAKQKRQIIQLLDTFIENEQLKRKTG